MTAVEVVTNWTSLVQQSTDGDVRDAVNIVSFRLSHVMQKHPGTLAAPLFQDPAQFVADHQKLKSYLTQHGDELAIQSLIEGLAAAIRSELALLSGGENTIPGGRIAALYDAVLKDFLLTGNRQAIFQLNTRGSNAIRMAISAIVMNIDESDLLDILMMLMFLREFRKEGDVEPLGDECLDRPYPEGLEREFILLRLHMVRKLLEVLDERKAKKKKAIDWSTFRFLYDRTAIREHEKLYSGKGLYMDNGEGLLDADWKAVSVGKNEKVKHIITATLEDTKGVLEARLMALLAKSFVSK